MRLERRRDGWHVVEPIERAASDGRVVTALSVLAARARSCYPVAEHEPAEFGLDRPRLRMEADEATVEFGDRAADGRRYVRAGDRFCLLPDQYWPLLKQGLNGLAAPSILGAATTPRRIATPGAEARRSGTDDGWEFSRGSGDAKAWAAHWRGARAFTAAWAVWKPGRSRARTDYAEATYPTKARSTT